VDALPQTAERLRENAEGKEGSSTGGSWIPGQLVLRGKCQGGLGHPHLAAPAPGWKKLLHRALCHRPASPHCAMPCHAGSPSDHSGWTGPRPLQSRSWVPQPGTRHLKQQRGRDTACPGKPSRIEAPSQRPPHRQPCPLMSPGLLRPAKSSQKPSSSTPAGLVPHLPQPDTAGAPQEGTGAGQRGLESPLSGSLTELGSP